MHQASTNAVVVVDDDDDENVDDDDDEDDDENYDDDDGENDDDKDDDIANPIPRRRRRRQRQQQQPQPRPVQGRSAGRWSPSALPDHGHDQGPPHSKGAGPRALAHRTSLRAYWAHSKLTATTSAGTRHI